MKAEQVARFVWITGLDEGEGWSWLWLDIDLGRMLQVVWGLFSLGLKHTMGRTVKAK